MALRSNDRTRYRDRITHLIKNPPSFEGGMASEAEAKAHWAKYVCVLISGYIEQSIKEVLTEYAEKSSHPKIRSYFENTWPNSKNMSCAAISEILGHFDSGWADEFAEWLDEDERKKEINEIIKWRNNIAHGKESSTNNVTLASVSTKFKVACKLVEHIERLN